jgi:hypothetical protein
VEPAKNLHNTDELALELKGQLVLVLVGLILADTPHREMSEMMAAFREVGELGNLWLNERETILRGSRP